MPQNDKNPPRVPLTEDRPTSGMNPTESSRPISERKEAPKPKTPQNESADGRRLLQEDEKK